MLTNPPLPQLPFGRRALALVLAGAFAVALPAGAAGAGTGTGDPGVHTTAVRTGGGFALAEPGLRGPAVPGATFDVPVRSLAELRWENVVRQQIDVGCGAAALATILTYYFDFPATEQEIFQPLLEEAALRTDGAQVYQKGFSLAEIRRVAERGGLAAAAFRLSLEDLPRVRIPTITRITIHGYNHFVVLKQAVGGRVYVADPAFGNTSYRFSQFEDIWSGVVMGFALRSQNLPVSHLLLVDEDDEVFIDNSDVMRLAARRGAPATVPQQPTRTVDYLFDRITPQIPGLRSALPAFLTNSIEF